MKEFTIFWFSGDKEVVIGRNEKEAFNNAGYGNGAVKAVDFIANGDNREYSFNKETHSWEKNDRVCL